jgi:hypothetical protein
MHYTNGDSYGVDGHRIYRDESFPTYLATQLRHQEMNALTEEIANVIISTGVSLNDDTEALSEMNQLNTAIDHKISQTLEFNFLKSVIANLKVSCTVDNGTMTVTGRFNMYSSSLKKKYAIEMEMTNFLLFSNYSTLILKENFQVFYSDTPNDTPKTLTKDMWYDVSLISSITNDGVIQQSIGISPNLSTATINQLKAKFSYYHQFTYEQDIIITPISKIYIENRGTTGGISPFQQIKDSTIFLSRQYTYKDQTLPMNVYPPTGQPNGTPFSINVFNAPTDIEVRIDAFLRSSANDITKKYYGMLTKTVHTVFLQQGHTIMLDSTASCIFQLNDPTIYITLFFNNYASTAPTHTPANTQLTIAMLGFKNFALEGFI